MLYDLEARLTAAIAERDEYKRCYEMQREVTNNWQAEAERRGHKAEAAEAKATRLETALREALHYLVRADTALQANRVPASHHLWSELETAVGDAIAALTSTIPKGDDALTSDLKGDAK